MSTHFSDQALDACLTILQAKKNQLVPYKVLEQIIEENSERTMVIRADVQAAVAQLIHKGYPIQNVYREGYRYTGE